MEADEWKEIECKWPLQQRREVLRKDCTMPDPYCESAKKDLEVRTASIVRERRVALKEDGTRGESDFVGECG